MLLVGDKMRFVGVLLPELVKLALSPIIGVFLPYEAIRAGFGDAHLEAWSAKRSATVGVPRLVGVDDLKPFFDSGPIGDIGRCFIFSWIGEKNDL